jgi:hypothetical protein
MYYHYRHYLVVVALLGAALLFDTMITTTITLAHAQEGDDDEGGGTNPAAPVLIMPADMEFQATNLEDAVEVTFTVRAQDDVDGTALLDQNNILTQDNVGGDIAISCDPPSGSMFRPAPATYRVDCTATDTDGNIGSGSFFIRVRYPELEEPVVRLDQLDCSEYPDIIRFHFEVVGLPRTVSDYVIWTVADNDGTITHTEKFYAGGIGEAGATGGGLAGPTSVLGLGPYTITYIEATGPEDPNYATADNIVPLEGGLRASTTFSCEPEPPEEDITPPIITAPEDLTVEATGRHGAEVSFEEEVTAEDDVDGPVDVSCDHNSGDTFPIGETLVTCTAEDAAGNPAEESFTITVQDTTAPDVEITGAVDRSGREITDGSGRTPIPYIEITFEATDAVGIDEIECSLDGQAFTPCTSPVSYDRLSRSTHEVTVRATDEVGNTGEDEFSWTIGAPPSNTGGARNR